MSKERNYKFETLQLHVGQEQPDPVTDARAVPIYQTSSYVFRNCDHAAARFGLADAGNIYGRLTNPTEDVFEQRIAALEGGVAALAVASGAAAITYAIENITKAGDHVVAAKNIYGGTYNFLEHTLPDYGIETTFVDIFNEDEVRAAIQDNTKLLFIETLGNPNSDVVDIEKAAAIAHEHNIPLIVDNTFATPYLVRPIEYGADIVVHSATKFIGGHGTTIGGVIIDGGKFDWEASGKFPSLVEPNPSYHGVSFTKDVGAAAFVTKIRALLLRDTGATLSPVHAFIFLQGLETLSLRVERHVQNALKVVEYMKNHPNIIVNSTGSNPLLPSIKGLHDHIDKEGSKVASITGMINHLADYPEDCTGKKVVVVGGGAVGLDVVEYFAPKGAQVSIVEMMPQIGKDLDPVSKCGTNTLMREHNVNQMTETALCEVKADAFTVKANGEEKDLPFDYGFVCLGMRANAPVLDEIREAFADTNVEIINIGDSVRARRIIDGVQEGHNILNVLADHEYL
jgi:O-acetylhomoserine (thiol)-lyase